jgi:flagellin
MRINHNIAALNTHRQLSANNVSTGKSLEKLSSGLRINRAGDDAAGLAISEKMRGQIRGLDQATRNAQDGISLIQTTEGALNETHSILQRMRELAVQSANDTNTSSDRAELQKEVDQLAKEVTRIGNSTEFNTRKLLDGTFTGTLQIGANAGQNVSLDVGDMRALELGVVSNISATIDPTVAIVGGNDTLATGAATYTVALEGTTYQLKDTDGNVVATGTNGKLFTGTGIDGDGSAFGDDTITLTETAKVGGTVVMDATGGVDKFDATIANTTLDADSYTANVTTNELTDSSGKVIATTTDDILYKDASGTTVLTFGAAITANTALTVGGIDISSQTTANTAITKINTAVEAVSAERSKLGAFQNRLEHTINNLGTSSENLTGAESRIRDVDMAKEMMEFTKNNILTQAAQAMLAQANQQPQGVLQLLR